MKQGKKYNLFAVAVLAVSMMFLFTASGQAADAASAKAVLTSDDCVKCHSAQPADIAANGGKHKNVSCQDCHTGHRPSSKNNIPQCNMCHQGKSHFELKNCLECHKNPHTPKKITFANNLTAPCLTCHTKQNDQLKENKSKHSALFCTTCHTVHGEKPACTKCHKPHSSDVTAADCKLCHKAHMPKVVAYGSDTPGKLCSACHAKAYSLLTASKTKHGKFNCAFCHQQKHKMIPKCQDCHGTPHPQSMMAKFSRCGECHNIAHDLNNWSAAKEEKAKEEHKATKKKK